MTQLHKRFTFQLFLTQKKRVWRRALLGIPRVRDGCDLHRSAAAHGADVGYGNDRSEISQILRLSKCTRIGDEPSLHTPTLIQPSLRL